MSQNIKRSIHCSFCEEEGHTISSCQDSRINIVVKDFNESIALDMRCNFKQKYIKYIMNSIYSIADIRILGYQKGISMNKTSKDQFINDILDEYYDIKNNKYAEIFNEFNETELNDFAKNISKSSKQWNSRKLSLPKTKELLGIQSEPNQIKNKTITSLVPYDDISDSNEELLEHDYRLFLLPIIDDNTINELSPILKQGLYYMYFFSIGAVALNLYIVYTTW